MIIARYGKVVIHGAVNNNGNSYISWGLECSMTIVKVMIKYAWFKPEYIDD